MKHIPASPLFAGVSEPQLEALFETIHCRVKHFAKDDVIVFANDSCEQLMIVSEGTVAGVMNNFDGKTITIEEMQAPSSLAEAYVFGQNNTYPVTVIAKTDCSIFIIPKDSLLLLFQSNAKILSNFLNSISNRTQFLSTKIRFLSFNTIKGKLASYILKLSNNNKLTTVMLPQTQESLAGLFGVARPSLARALAELEHEGAITVHRKQITIVNRKALLSHLRE